MTSQTIITDRRLFINVLRGIAIFLMLWGHCIQCCCQGSFDFFENSVFRVIYCFHMPLFMIISGYLFFFSMRRRNLQDLLIHKTQSLLQPIIMCGILGFLLWNVVIGALSGNFTVIFNGGWLGNLTPYWFLWSVLSSSIAVGIACKATNRRWLSVIILALGFPFVYMMPCAEENVFMYPYFIVGCWFSAVKNTDWMKKISGVKYLSLVLFPIMELFYRKEHYIYTSGLFGDEGLIKHMPVNMYRWAIGLVGSIFVIVLLELVFKIAKETLAKTHTILLLKKLGEKSLQVYILSYIFLSCYLPLVYHKFISLLGQNILAENMIVYNFIFTPLLTLGYSIGLLLIVRILEKTKVSKILFGK